MERNRRHILTFQHSAKSLTLSLPGFSGVRYNTCTCVASFSRLEDSVAVSSVGTWLYEKSIYNGEDAFVDSAIKILLIDILFFFVDLPELRDGKIIFLSIRRSQHGN